MPAATGVVEHHRERVHRDRADDPASLAFDEDLRARHVATEAVGVADRHDADPGRPIGDEPTTVAGALTRLELLHERDVRLPAQSWLEPVVRPDPTPNGEMP